MSNLFSINEAKPCRDHVAQFIIYDMKPATKPDAKIVKLEKTFHGNWFDDLWFSDSVRNSRTEILKFSRHLVTSLAHNIICA